MIILILPGTHLYILIVVSPIVTHLFSLLNCEKKKTILCHFTLTCLFYYKKSRGYACRSCYKSQSQKKFRKDKHLFRSYSHSKAFFFIYIEAPYRQNILQRKPLFYLNKLKNDAAWQSNVKQ